MAELRNGTKSLRTQGYEYIIEAMEGLKLLWIRRPSICGNRA